ncbi:tetraspanin-32 isoform X2 [Canis lupus familiaris]|uniref:Tetraspanin n=2 Tax=Canis lupus familiaris TaxID=9615 RepID=A0A8I3N985_CANLF|nr:tetraspanin-32 isoform X1 [Canis lupus dingo]XP_038280609.1 tetraspanin-32 isoform X2 [Canis lupus familiaris]XP_038418421.1 tetraspanin-32 isoform X2 [Canis lupus familiaris]XP_540788.3 tetraspanin-32 isoform X2 [Canis lupus familiaris]|eukprot:XP_540788.3 tetraspanin-32 isoform X1 [Canis lupus familiaris]
MATMGPWSRVRMVKCQMLVTSFFVLLLGLSMATLAALTYYGAHFAVIGHASSDKTPYEAMHRWTFYAGISLAGLLTVGAVLGAAATMREAGGLMAGGFLCFALVFGALVEVAFWRFHNPTQVEDAVLDTYDLVYDQAVKNVSGTPQQQLVAIQDTFLCCGKNSPFSLLGDLEVSLCQGEEAARQDCLVGIRSFLRMYGNIASILTGIGLAAMVYAMLLSSFLWFAIRSGCSLDRKGKYTLSRRAPDCQPQEPSFFRHSPGWPVLQHPTEVDVPHGHLGASSPSGGPQLLQDS